MVGVVSAVAAVAGGIMQNASGQRQARAAREQAEAQARVAEENARQAQVASAYEDYQHRYRTSKLIGEQRAKFGKAGVIMEGTPLEIMEDTAYQSELDSMAIKYRGNVSANRSMMEASGYRSAGSSLASAYSSAAGTSLLTGFTTGLGHMVRVSDSWKSYKTS